MDQLNDTNFKKSCRTCLTLYAEEMISIFAKINQVENNENTNTCICDMLMDVALIKLDRKESLPTLICINCLRLTQLLFNFRKQCNRSQTVLLEYLIEKENKERKTLGTKESPNLQDWNVLNEYKPENDVNELSNSDDSFHTSIKLELVDELNVSDTESENQKEDKVIGNKKSQNHDSDILSKKSAIKESITNNVNELSNPSSSDDLLNASIKLEYDDDIIKSSTESECKETLHSKFFGCQLCDNPFKTETLYFAHTKQHAEEKYACNKCNKPFKHHRSLTAHMKKHAEDKLLACNICNEQFVYRRALNAHMQQHPENKPVCNVCGKRFDLRRNLAVHLHTHKDEKRFSCKICGKKFKQASSVIPHMRSHTGQKPILCSVCGRRFNHASKLKIHMRTHTKERPYMCNVCGITMPLRYRLVRHMRTHTGEKPYKCTECDKSFIAPDQLRAHLFVHTGLKPYSCDVCKKSFNRRSTLKLHAKIHTDDRPHACVICGKTFIQAHCLKTHLQTHAK